MKIPEIFYSMQVVFFSRFMKQITQALGFDPTLAGKKSHRKQPQIEKKESQAALTLCNGDFNDKDAMESKDDQKQTQIDIGEDVVIQNGNAEISNLDLPQLSTISYPSTGVTHVILDMSRCSYVDNDGAQTIKKLNNTLRKIDIKLCLAECNSKYWAQFCDNWQIAYKPCAIERKSIDCIDFERLVCY